jgi:2-hydroxycyclohexanecarboxyl-CoA dehydrogenase
VNAVGPGPIFAPFHARRIAAAGVTVEQNSVKAALRTIPKRPGRAEEVAAAILFLVLMGADIRPCWSLASA